MFVLLNEIAEEIAVCKRNGIQHEIKTVKSFKTVCLKNAQFEEKSECQQAGDTF